MREYVKLSITFYKEKAGRRKIKKEKELRDKCGCIYARFNKKKRNSPEHIVVDSAIDFSEYYMYKTLQYYDGEQKIILSPKLYRVIKSFIKVQEIIPIF